LPERIPILQKDEVEEFKGFRFRQYIRVLDFFPAQKWFKEIKPTYEGHKEEIRDDPDRFLRF